MTIALASCSIVLAEIIVGSPQWTIPAIVLAVVLSLMTLWNYVQSGALKARLHRRGDAVETSWNCSVGSLFGATDAPGNTTASQSQFCYPS